MKNYGIDNAFIIGIAAIILAVLQWIFGDWENTTKLERGIFYSIVIIIIMAIILIARKEKLRKVRSIEEDNKEQFELLEQKQKKEIAKKDRLLREIKKQKKLEYAEVFPQVISAISEFVNGFSTHAFIHNLEVLLSNMATYYKQIKRVECCFTLKIIDSQNGKIETLARTNGNSERELREDFLHLYETFTEFLRDNSDLSSIYLGKSKKIELKGLKYFSNNLLEKNSFRNSLLTKEEYHHKIDNYEGQNKDDFIKAIWPLPYKSTIVVPLGLMRKTANDTKFELAGTLCVDCSEIDIFDKELDVSILQSLAETIYLTWRSPNKIE